MTTKSSASNGSPRRPLLGIAILFVAGIVVGTNIFFPIWILFALCFVVLGAFLVAQWAGQRLAPSGGSVFLYAAIFAGGVMANELATFRSPIHLYNQIGERRASVALRGLVVGVPTFEEWPGSQELAGRAKVELAVSEWREAEAWRRAEGRVMVVLPVEKEAAPPSYGDELEVRGAIERPALPMNFGQFDYRRELERRRIFYLVHVRSPNDVVIVAGKRGNPVVAAVLASRDYLRRALHCGIEDDTKVTSLLDAMLLGYRQPVVESVPARHREGEVITPFAEQEQAAPFQISGVAHVFAINGLHVGLVAGVLVVLLTALSIRRSARLVFAIVLLAFYTLVTGARPGAVRALIMATALLAGWGLRQKYDLLNGIGAAALVILLLDPLDLFGSGFQLSFAVVISIVLIAPTVRERVIKRFESDPWIPPSYRSVWGYRLQEPTFYATGLIGASVGAWVGTLPLLAFYYNLFSPIALVANLLVVPMLTLVIALGILSVVGFSIWPWLAATLNNANWLAVKSLVGLVALGARLPSGHQYVAAPPLWAIVSYYALVVLAASGWLWRARWRWIAAATVTCALAMLFLTVSVSREALTVTVLHTNGGQAILIEPSRCESVLLDAGSESAGKYLVVPYLRGRGVDRLGAVVMSHGEAAFVGGMRPVLEKFPVGVIYDTDAPSRSPTYREMKKLPRRVVKRGDAIFEAGGLKFRVLHPFENHFYSRADDNSVVLLLEYRDHRILFTAAVGETVERELLASDEDLRAEIIVKSQHYRETSCTEAFLDRVQPRAVIFSAGEYPSSAYPRAEILERLQKRGIAVYRTDEQGSVRIVLGRGGVRLESFRAKD